MGGARWSRSQIRCALYENTNTDAMSLCKVFIFALTVGLLPTAVPTRIKGSWSYSPSNRLKYLTKFGVQKNHQVFTYGTSVRATNTVGLTDQLVLAFVPTSTWDSFYDLEKHNGHTCEDIMSGPFNASMSPYSQCSKGTADLYRVVPCNYQQECRNQQGSVVQGSNLTFRTTSPKTQYYYLFLVGCRQNSSSASLCDWASSSSVVIEYDIHIVTQDPDPTLTPHPDPFIYQFSYDKVGMMVIYIIFSSIYLAVVAFHLTMHSCICTPHGYKHHRITNIFSASLVLEFLHVVLIMTHYSVFSVNGVGVQALLFIGQATNFISDWLLILVLILIGKGWQITTATVRWKVITLVVWIAYIIVSAIFFTWTVIKETVFPITAEQRDNHQTWASGLYLAYRILLLLYILWEMRQIYLIENRRFKLILYRCFLVLYIAWFCYLPVVVIIASCLNPLERARVIATSILTFDLIMDFVMVLLFCPKWSQQYFQFSSHLNYLTRVTMHSSKSGLTHYHTLSSSFPSITNNDDD